MGSEQIEDSFFYIQCTDADGDLVLWWKPKCSGYTSRIEEAGLYTRDEAAAIKRARGTDIPWPVSQIEKVARRYVHVDALHELKAAMRERG